MEPKLKLPGHPDEVFGGKGEKTAIMKPQVMLTEEVAALGASLNITSTPSGNDPYEPDAFVAAIRKTHDQLMEIKAKLVEQKDRQAARETELKAREAEIAFREKRINGMEALAHKKSWWRL
jgi:hypothetical protein